MISNRQLKLLDTLRRAPMPLSAEQLAAGRAVSVRTVQNDLAELNDFLKKRGLPFIGHRRGDGVFLRLTEDGQSQLDRALEALDVKAVLWKPEERLKVFLKILLYQEGFITLNAVADRMDVSRNTVLGDLDKLRRAIKGKNFCIAANSRRGIRLEGEEEALREYALAGYLEDTSVSCIREAEEYDKYSFSNRYFRTREYAETRVLYDAARSVEVALRLKLTAPSFLLTLASLELTVDRVRLGHPTEISQLKLESIMGSEEFKAVYRMGQALKSRLGVHLPLEELGQLTGRVMGGSIMRSALPEDMENMAEIQVIVCNLIHAVGQELDIDFSQDITLYDDLVYHIRPAIYRMKNAIPQKNVLLDQIKGDYPTIFAAVRRNVDTLERLASAAISEDEMGYITVHFAAMIEKQRRSGRRRPVAIIVCDSGIGTSNLLSTRLASLYEVKVARTVAYHELEQAMREVRADYILTTIDLPTDLMTHMGERGVEILRINSLIGEGDLPILDRHFQHRYQEAISFPKLVGILEKSCTILDRQRLYEDLNREFCLTSDQDRDRGDEPMLKDVINERMVELDYPARNWEEAVREAGRLLRQEGCVDQTYVENMVEVVKRMGAYIVIGKGIALPHSRSAEGASKIGVCMLRLAAPVNFGHPENDPVDLVFGLSSVDNKSHLRALADLSRRLSDNGAVERLRRLGDTQAVYAVLCEG